MLVYFRLVREGFGSLREVMEFDARVVLQAINYGKFINDYQRAYLELNKT